MIRNYLSIVLRHIRHSPLYAFINVFGLAIGLACCIVIYLFIKDEKSFDDFHSKKENIYRLNQVQNFSGAADTRNLPTSAPGMGPSILNEFPEVVSFTRINNREKQLVVKDEKRFILPHLMYVDSTFLEIFDFELLHGDRRKALDEPNTMVVTKSTALKFFKNPGEAMGNTLTYMNVEHKITGILENVPENSHLQFDVLTSMTSFSESWNNLWMRGVVNTYLLLQSNTKAKALEDEFPALLRRHVDDPDINKRIVLYLQRLDDVHLTSTEIDFDYNNYRRFNGTYLDIFAIVGMFILLIAGFNFANLTTARASQRWREIGVRKTVGAKKSQLFLQFVFESAVFSFFAVLVAALIVILFLPLTNDLIGRNLSFARLLNEPSNILYIIPGMLAFVIVSGIYPSIVMTSYNTVRVLKGGGKGDARSFLRSGLVVGQFSLAVGMIVSTLVVLQQLSYIKNKDLGYDKEQMMLIDMDREAGEKFEMLRTELKRSPLILGVTASSHQLGQFYNENRQEFQVKSHEEVLKSKPSKMNVDYEYLAVYGIKLKEGRNFSKDLASDNGMAFIINESLARELALKETVGAPAGPIWYHNDSLGTIIGVVEDFNFKSLHDEIYPLEMEWHPDWGYSEMSVKIDGARVEDAIAFVKDTWTKHINYPFDYSFLDEHFENLYRAEQQMGAVVTVMAGLAIFISCMGLFGLAAITTERKTKEIGIRKVLGATERQIMTLLSRNFTVLIILSVVLASPATYWFLSRWLESFAYRISINPLLFLTGGGIALAIALLTISYHTLRSARANPVDALRSE